MVSGPDHHTALPRTGHGLGKTSLSARVSSPVKGGWPQSYLPGDQGAVNRMNVCPALRTAATTQDDHRCLELQLFHAVLSASVCCSAHIYGASGDGKLNKS